MTMATEQLRFLLDTESIETWINETTTRDTRTDQTVHITHAQYPPIGLVKLTYIKVVGPDDFRLVNSITPTKWYPRIGKKLIQIALYRT